MKSLRTALLGSVMCLGLVAWAPSASAQPTNSEVREMSQRLLAQAERSAAAARYDEAASLAHAAAMLLQLAAERCTTGGSPPVISTVAVPWRERELSTRL
jgi:hypothetical protein